MRAGRGAMGRFWAMLCEGVVRVSRRRKLSSTVAIVVQVLAVQTAAVGMAIAQPSASCVRGDFEAVVDAAGGALRDLNVTNRPAFQAKLRELKDKRGWSHDEFLAQAAPFVQDEKIAVFDQTSQMLLGEIAVMGQEGSEARQPDCALLDTLRERMDKLVAAQKEKWAYMFGKIEKALAE